MNITPALLIDVLQGDVLFKGSAFQTGAVNAVIASDLMSDVLVATGENLLLVTSLASEQMIRTADLVGAAAVVLVNGKLPPKPVLRLAEELDITLMRSPLPKYEACLAVGSRIARGS